MTLQDAGQAAGGLLKYGPTGFAVIVLGVLVWNTWSLQEGFDTRSAEMVLEISKIEDTILDVSQRAAESEALLAEKRLELFVELMQDLNTCNAAVGSGGNTANSLGNGAETPAPKP